MFIISYFWALISGFPLENPPISKHAGYFQYANSPAHDTYEAGWKKGNYDDYQSRFTQVVGDRFRSSVDWKSGSDGYGQSFWEYNHSDLSSDKKQPEYPPVSGPDYTIPEYHVQEPPQYVQEPEYHPQEHQQIEYSEQYPSHFYNKREYPKQEYPKKVHHPRPGFPKITRPFPSYRP